MESSVELLAGFFRYFAYELDCRSSVVSTPSRGSSFLSLLLVLLTYARVKYEVRDQTQWRSECSFHAVHLFSAESRGVYGVCVAVYYVARKVFTYHECKFHSVRE